MQSNVVSAWQFQKQLNRGNAGEQILQDLKEQILVGQIASGTKLPSEKELAIRYGVSTPTVRNAMRGLASAGLITVRHGSGAFVTADSDGLIASSLGSVMRRERVSLRQMLTVAVALNGLAAELAAGNATRHELDLMQAALRDIEDAQNIEEVMAAYRAFLATLAQASGNPLLASLCRSMVTVQLDAVQTAAGVSFEVWRKSGKQLGAERQRLLDAISSRNPDEARAAAKAYYDRALNVISMLLGASEAF
jgi:GntR family transcriptional repressor for pyruvate dehydrogenase complex